MAYHESWKQNQLLSPAVRADTGATGRTDERHTSDRIQLGEGINEPDFAGLCRLAEAFGITLNDFAADDRTAGPEQTDGQEDAARGRRLTQASAGILDGAALFAGVLIFFLGGFLIGGWKGWVGSFIAGGCIFLAISSVFHAIAAMRK